MSTTATAPTITPDERKAKLDALIVDWTRGGWKLETRSDYQAVISKGHRPNHILHLLLTIFTLGLWAIVWIIVSITSREKRKTLAVDENGRTSGR